MSKRKKKKKIGAVIATTCLALAFAGCGGNAPKAADTGKKITIEYWHINNENFGLPTVRELIKSFEAENPNIKVNDKYFNGYMPLMQGVQAAMASGNPPAVAQIGYNYLDYATKSIPHVTIDEIIARHKDDSTFLSANYLPNILELGKLDNKQHGMPYSISNPIVYFNPELFQKAGLDPAKGPKTWAEVESFSRQIKEKTGAYGVYVQEPADTWAQQAMMMSNGAKVLVKNGNKATTDIGEAAAIEAMEQYARMVKEGIALHTGHEEGYQAYISGKTAMLITTIARRAAVEKNAPFKSSACPFPTYGDKPRHVLAGGNNLFIFAKSTEQQDAAWKFIKHLQKSENLTAWTKGTGYLPPRKGVAEDPNGLLQMTKENIMLATAIGQLPDVRPWLSFPGQNGLQIEQILLDIRDSILTGKMNAQDAMTQGGAKINELLK